MKIQIFILTFLALLYFISAAEENQRNYGSQGQEMDTKSSSSEDESSSFMSTSTQSSPRQRRSPSRFDSNNMKGKYSKANKQKRSADPFEYYKGSAGDRANLMQFLQPTAALASAAWATRGFQESTTSTPSP